MAQETQPNYANVQTSNRTAEELARLHGFESLQAFAQSLPQNAKVTDVGAGDSGLGQKVAAIRSDVTWTNIDFSYYESLPAAARHGQENVRYIAGDATKLDQIIEPESQDRVLSYWMLPHLSLHSDEPVMQAARAMWVATKPGGTLSIGPDMSQKGRLPALRWPKAFSVTKNETMSADSFAEKVAHDTKARGFTRLSLILSSEVTAPFFGTSRYLRRDAGRHELFDPNTGDYIPVKSWRATKLMGRLAVAGARYLRQQHKAK